ncbi:MAG: carbonic anhydrase [Candidatus Ancaeobacter aquaticus]|nr:carbonic anhydrase [Candidatus Ancaeobacter aquaticus]
MEHKIIPVTNKENIPEEYRDNPIGLLFEYHNLNRQYDTYLQAQLLIGMCMDSRKHLHIPPNFAYIIRSGGANLRYSEFKVAYAIAVGKVSHIALIGHNNCAMVNLASKKEEFINGLVDRAGWSRGAAEECFMNHAPKFEIGNEIEFIVSETNRLRKKYPKIMVASLYYKVEDNKLYFISES